MINSLSRIQIEGKVVQRAECGPIQNKSYMSIKREAIIKAGEPVTNSFLINSVIDWLLINLTYK